MNSPCKYCPDRSATCHGTCEKYKAYKSEYEEFKAAEKAKRAVWRAFNGYQIQSIRNNYKRTYREKRKKGV